MTLSEAEWSRNNPGPPPEVYVPFKERVFRIINKAVAKHAAEAHNEDITHRDKKQIAAEYREHAERIERG